MVGRPRVPVLDRVVVGVVIDLSGCWIYAPHWKKPGYRHVTVWEGDRKVNRMAHRVVYELLVGPIPDGLELDHLCRVRSCVNPDHLEPVTSAENTRRAKALIIVCPQGHVYDAGNTGIYNGQRYCRECKRTAALARYHRSHVPYVAPAFCPQGHEFTPENTRVRKDGKHGRECRECNRIRAAKWREARQKEIAA